VEDNIQAVARILKKRVQDVVVLVMDRPRHENLIEEIRRAGASLRTVGDGDIAAAIAPAIFDSGIDLYVGTGGSPEAVLASAALKCLGGEMQALMWPKDDEEQKCLVERGYDLNRVYRADDLAQGKNIIFAATGISDSPLVKGVQVRDHMATTHSILMRAKSGTMRQITAHHDLRKKTIRLRSDNREHRL
jgi:fructose-1,6-bisphosphatase II